MLRGEALPAEDEEEGGVGDDADDGEDPRHDAHQHEPHRAHLQPRPQLRAGQQGRETGRGTGSGWAQWREKAVMATVAVAFSAMSLSFRTEPMTAYVALVIGPL